MVSVVIGKEEAVSVTVAFKFLRDHSVRLSPSKKKITVIVNIEGV